MALFGIYIQKSSIYDPDFKNQYYVEYDDIDDARVHGLQLVTFEKAIFSGAVNFDVLHVWQVNATPPRFIDLNLSGVGELPVTNPSAAQMCVQVDLNSAVGFGGYKKYRCHLDNTAQLGNRWQQATLDAIQEVIDEMSDVLLATTTRSLVTFTSATLRGTQEFEQLSKRWYNRSSS